MKGLDTIRKYADLIRYDDHELLATEYPFIVPIDGTWDDEPVSRTGSQAASTAWPRGTTCAS